MLLVAILQREDLCSLQQSFLTLQVPSAYLNFVGKPHVGGITLNQPPLSNHCIDLPDSLPKLEQNATVMKLPKADRNSSNPAGQSTPRISLFRPLQTEYQCIYADRPNRSTSSDRNQDGCQFYRQIEIRMCGYRATQHSSGVQRFHNFPLLAFSTPLEN